MNGILFWFCFEHQADGSTAGMTRKVNLSCLRRARTVVVVFQSSNEVCCGCSDSCFAVTVALLVRVPGFVKTLNLCLTERSIISFFKHLTCFVFALLCLLRRPSDSGMAATDMMPDDATTGGGRDPGDVQPTPSGSMCAVKFLVCHY